VITTSVPDALLAEQADFAALLHELRPDDWDRPSLCPDWTVRDVVRHAAFHIHRQGLRQTLGSSEKWEAILAAEAGADTDEALLAWFESDVPAKAADSEVNLAELVIHQLDVRRPLGSARTTPDETLVGVLDQLNTFSGSLFVVDRRRRLGRGLRLAATDLDWTSGDGPEVTGAAEDLLLGIAGRAAAYAGLDGPGVAELARRQAAES
jgi:uncharacterized protein (TIGR03083 family)